MLQISYRYISGKKEKKDNKSQINNEEINNAIKIFIKTQNENNYHFSWNKNMKNEFEGIRLTFYKQIQYLNAYLYTKQVENSIIICL